MHNPACGSAYLRVPRRVLQMFLRILPCFLASLRLGVRYFFGVFAGGPSRRFPIQR
jgi:hypothetical protein